MGCGSSSRKVAENVERKVTPINQNEEVKSRNEESKVTPINQNVEPIQSQNHQPLDFNRNLNISQNPRLGASNDLENDRGNSSQPDEIGSIIELEQSIPNEIQNNLIGPIKIFISLEDTSETYKIKKYLFNENSLNEINKLPDNFQIVSLYGIAETIKNYLIKVFTNFENFPEEEGVYLIFNMAERNGVIVFITEDEKRYITKEFDSSCHLVTMIRILSDLSFKILACLSEEILESWYYKDEDGKRNPFEYQNSSNRGVMLRDKIIKELHFEKINFDYEKNERNKYYMTKDKTNVVFQYKFEEIPDLKKNDIEEKKKKIFDKLIRLKKNDQKLQLEEIIKEDLKEFTFNVKKLSEKLNDSLIKMINRKTELKNKVIQNIKGEILSIFSYPFPERNYNIDKDNMIEKNIRSAIKKGSNNRQNILKKLVEEFKDLELNKYCLDNIIKNHYSKYIKDTSIEEVEKTLDIIINEIKNKVATKDKIRDVELTIYLISEIKEVAKKLLVEKISRINFIKAIGDAIIPFLDGKIDQLTVIINEIDDYLKNLIELRNEFKNSFFSHLKFIDKIFLGIQFHLFKSNFSALGDPLTAKVSKPKVEIKHYFPTKTLKVKQIMILDPRSIFVLLSNHEKKVTHILSCDGIGNYKKCDDIDDSDVILAWGSSFKQFLMFKNNKKFASLGFLKENKQFEVKTELEIYNKFNYVVSCFYLKENRLFIIDDSGCIKLAEIVNISSIIQLKNFVKINDEFGTRYPKNGEKFLDICILENEILIFLLTDVDIECYNNKFESIRTLDNLNHLSSFNIIKLSRHFLVSVSDTGNEINCIKLAVPNDETQLESKNEISEIIVGNPIFDIHHYGIIKFGPLDKDTQIIKGERSLGYYNSSGDNDKLKNYLKNLKELKSNFKRLYYIEPSKLFQDVKEIEKSDFILSIRVKIPLQIAYFNNNNLVPLENGIRFEGLKKKLTPEEFSNKIKFGVYEKIFEEHKEMPIISILGMQSSGKSYLLNRLGGTRFDVSTERCTQGIWVGVGRIKETYVVFFDTEGVFSIERTNQEIIKLCAFVSSVSSVIILNTDISSDKGISKLITQFKLGKDKCNGSDLFNGHLDISYRDIGIGQQKGASKVFNNLLDSLNDLLVTSKIFKSLYLNSLYHNFEIVDFFKKDLDSVRSNYLEIFKKNMKINNISETVKKVLSQIDLDDGTCIDKRIFNDQKIKNRDLIDEILINTETAKNLLKNEIFNHIIEHETGKVVFNLEINQFYHDKKKPLKYFLDSLEESKSKNFFEKNHKFWNTELDKVIQKFFQKRNNLIISFFREKMPKAEEFKNDIDYEIKSLIIKLDNIATKFRMCLRKCGSCDFICVKLTNHDNNCDCGTNHNCKEFCSHCQPIKGCSLLNGHTGSHICYNKHNSCTRECSKNNCTNICTLNKFHESIDCQCSSSHPCNQNCKFHHNCQNYCMIIQTEDHEIHNCGKTCPHNCYFEDGNMCSNKNPSHDHEIKQESCKKKYHLCESQHICKYKCEHDGVCDIKVKESVRQYVYEGTILYYKFYQLFDTKLKCKKIIDKGEISHESIHHCGEIKHTCIEQCPDCHCYCDLEYDHIGDHSSDKHRNKDYSIYISTEEVFDSELKNGEVKTAVKYKAGEPASPEICNDYCSIKNRGHAHPIICKGGTSCMGITHKNFALHSDQKYHSGNNELYMYDLLTCDIYWKINGWLPPNHKDPIIQETFGKCNFMCGHESHKEENEKIFCESFLFHSLENDYNSHNFKCNHDYHDIVFIIDSSKSMDKKLKNLKKIIIGLITKWGERKNKYAIIAYKDHKMFNNRVDMKSPVTIFPDSKNLEDGSGSNAINFSSKIQLIGGNSIQGKALVDALFEANRLKFREYSAKMFILICDDTPHGKEFRDNSEYPDGCPCGKSWQEQLNIMKNNKVKFIFVKLEKILNRTVDLFKEIYGNGLEVIEKNEIENIKINMTKKVIHAIEKNFVVSKNIAS